MEALAFHFIVFRECLSHDVPGSAIHYCQAKDYRCQKWELFPTLVFESTKEGDPPNPVPISTILIPIPPPSFTRYSTLVVNTWNFAIFFRNALGFSTAQPIHVSKQLLDVYLCHVNTYAN